MEENKTLNDMNSEQSINTETPVLENPIADMAPVAEMPAAEVVTEAAPDAEKPAPVTTPSDEPETPNVNSDPLNHPVAAADKYTYSADGVEYTVYLKSGSNNFYYLTSAGCVSGNYGTYTEVDGTLTLQSEAYYNCESCYYTSADATNGGMATLVMSLSRDTAANTLSNADGSQIFTFAGTEEIGNPFNLEGVHSCDNLENAN